jgi:hypothetical protein
MSSKSDTALAVLVRPTTFHPFPKLPFELRTKIWILAANEKRTITVQEDYVWTGYGDDSIFTTSLVKHNAHSVPAILRTSYEARSAALRNYELYVSPCFKNKGFYINFASDTLAIQSLSALWSLYDGLQETQTSWPAHVVELEQKLRLLGVRNWAGALYRSRDLLRRLRRFWRLEELLISTPREDDWNQKERRAKVEKKLCDGWGALGCGENRPAITWLLEEERLGDLRGGLCDGLSLCIER